MRHKATYQELPRMEDKDEHGHGGGDTKRGMQVFSSSQRLLAFA